MHHATRILAVAAIALLACGPASADLIGTSVTGSIDFGGNGVNYFDPARGFVPPGYLNYTEGTTVTIAQPQIEFGYMDSSNLDTANFTGNQLIVTDTVSNAANFWTMTFTDTAFTGLPLTKVSDTFTHGGVTGTLVGDTITVFWGGTGTADGLLAATFDVGVSSIPEPSAIVMACTAIPLALGYWWRNRSTA
jgi:hypothetical protein